MGRSTFSTNGVINVTSLAFHNEAHVPFNLTNLTEDIDLNRFSRLSLILAAVCTIIILTVGVVGNFLTIVALLRCPRVRNVAAAFIVSLCVADFLFCLIVLPFNASRFINGAWVHDELLCKIVPFVQYGNVGVSLLSIAMITINRYIMIAHYRLYSRIYRPVWIACMIVFCYLLSFGMQVPTLLGVWGSYAFDERLGTCSIIPDSKGRSSKTSLFIIGFVIPCVIIICCYANIFWVVHSSEKRMRRHNALQTNQTKKEQKDIKTKRNEWRITKMVLVIFLSFVMCYLPITIAKVLDSEVNKPGLHVMSYIFIYMSACINPIIYVIMNKQYRVAYKTVLMCKRPRLLSSTHMNGNQNQNNSKFGDREDQSKTMLSSVQCSIALTRVPASDMSDVFLEDK